MAVSAYVRAHACVLDAHTEWGVIRDISEKELIFCVKINRKREDKSLFVLQELIIRKIDLQRSSV